MLAVIPIEMIENGQRLRDIGEAQVESLMNSIGDVGLLNPITVYPRKLFRNGQHVDGYGLIAGLHRKTACERLGLVEIEANVLDLPDLERQIAECDENLCAPALSASDRARFTLRRKEAYEALHPEAKHGGDRKSDQVADSATRSFADDQAEKTGAAPRTVRLHAERGAKVDDAVLDLIRGTKLDTGAYLDKLKGVDRKDQFRVVQGDLLRLRTDQQSTRTKIKLADAPLNDEAAREKQVAALMSAWNRATAEARQEFLERIEQPVFDRGRAA